MLTVWWKIYTECFGLFIYSSRIYYRPAMCYLPLVFGNFLVNTAAKDPTPIVLHSNRNGRQTVNDLSISQEEWPVTAQTVKKGNGIDWVRSQDTIDAEKQWRRSCHETVQKISKQEMLIHNVNCWSGSRWRGYTSRGGGHGGGREWYYSRYTWGWNQLNLLMDSMWVVRKREKWVIWVGTPGTVHWFGKTR